MTQEITIPDKDIFTVSRLTREAKAVLEGSFPMLWIEGEISNFSRPSSGHMYFSLKDEAAQVRCAMFRGKNSRLSFKPENGIKVLVRARVTMYDARGEFQIIIESMEEAGFGILQRAFEGLKNKLQAEGLFDTDHKQDIPALPKQIGVITSATGAAIRDILSVLKRRFPSIPVLIYPVPVQGEGAGKEIAATLQRASQRKECDVLILSRGGGSLEDLWAFNEEVVARAIHRCEIPVVSGVGHEVDFTIADFVADMRAPTPSAAAELISPSADEWLQTINNQLGRLTRLVQSNTASREQQLTWLGKRFQQQHPGQMLQSKAQRLDELEQRLLQSTNIQLQHKSSHLLQLGARLQRDAPLNRLQQLQTRANNSRQRLMRAWQQVLVNKQQRVASSSRTLESVSPLSTLQRGYAIVQRHPNKEVVRDAKTIKPGDLVQTRLAKGTLFCTVDKIKND